MDNLVIAEYISTLVSGFLCLFVYRKLAEKEVGAKLAIPALILSVIITYTIAYTIALAVIASFYANIDFILELTLAKSIGWSKWIAEIVLASVISWRLAERFSSQ